MRCMRCSEQVHKVDVCGQCERKVCRNCVKSSRRDKYGKRRVICKDCWGDIKKRKEYKKD